MNQLDFLYFPSNKSKSRSILFYKNIDPSPAQTNLEFFKSYFF
jgi:hypothetical protein